MKQNLEIMQALVVSTAHATSSEAEEFGGGKVHGAMRWEHGWMVYFGPDYDTIEDRFSDGVRDVIAVARDNGVEWVRFDEDGPVLDNCATYDW